MKSHANKTVVGSASVLPILWIAGCLGALLGGCQEAAPAHAEPEAREQAAPATPREMLVVRRTGQLEAYPCVEQCHYEREPNANARDLREFHTLRTVRHGVSMHWCSFCHRVKDLDKLQLLDGVEVSFDEAYRICGQCHGDKFRDWRAGVHGLLTGSWNDAVSARSCPQCHDPHSPRRPRFESLPPPKMPYEQRQEGAHE